MKNADLAVYISSFDGYSDLWDTFFEIFEHFWIDCPYSVYLVNNTKKYSRNQIKIINTGQEINWFNRTINSLNKIKEEYILFLLEDYFISKKIYSIDIDNIVSYMKYKHIYFYMLSLTHGVKRQTNSGKICCLKVRESRNYPINLQPAIWKKSELISFLEKINGQTPWDFEYYFNKLYNKSCSKIIQGIRYDTRDILGYKNAVLRGKWIPETLRYYNKLGIKINLGNRRRMTVWQEIKCFIAIIISYSLKDNTKIKIKKILNKFDISYL